MKCRYQVMLAMSALSIAGLAMAGEPAAETTATTMAAFSVLDADKDGKLSPAEATADQKVADQFVAADSNKDGYLEPTEYQAIAKS